MSVDQSTLRRAVRRKESDMGGLSPLHWILIIGILLLLFGGRGKLSSLMGDAAKGVKAFKDGLKDEHVEEKKDGPGATLPRTEAEKEDAKR
jgi:sec-independent protein translocase protein TatA